MKFSLNQTSYFKKSAQTFVFTLFITLFISLTLLLILSVQFYHKNSINKKFKAKKQDLNTFSFNELIKYELKHKKEEDRWQDGWIISGDIYIFKDIDGTIYQGKLKESLINNLK